MPLTMPAKGQDFENPPEGSHIAVCYRVVDLGKQRSEYQGKVSFKHKILISWELPEALMQDGRPFTIGKSYTYSSDPKSNLRKDLESWRGKAFEDYELGTFDIGKLISAGCMLGIAHRDTERGTYANVTAILRLPRGVSAPIPANPTICFSLADRPFDSRGFGLLSERLQDTIKRSPEYNAAIEGRDPNEEPPPPNGDRDYGSGRDLDDDIPF